MYVISVVPLKRGLALNQLTYFSGKKYSEGTVLKIPLRNTETLGLVTESKSVSAAKTALRAATFSLRRLPEQSETNRLGDAFIKTAKDLSTYYAAPLGTVLYSLLPPDIRNGDLSLPHTHHISDVAERTPAVLQATQKERLITYRSLVRETFAHSGSVLVVAPTSAEAVEVAEALKQGISDRVVLLSSASTKSEIKKAYAALEDFSKTKLIVATPSYALIERHDITCVIIEHARSAFYKTMTRPYLDYRLVLRTHAKYTGRKLLFGDMLLRTEEEYLRREEIYQTHDETPKRLQLPGKMDVIAVSEETDTAETFSLFTPKVIEAIKEVRRKRGRIFLYAARRGLAPVVACMDCGFIFRSPASGAPYSLLRTFEKGEEKRWFICGASGEKKPAPDLCPECSSWRLRERGIGIQQVYDELHKVLPSIPVVLFDHVSAKTYKKALFLRDTFYSSKRGIIMLGTSMTVPYLTKPVDLSVVVNMDALLATPTWRLEEENLSLLLSLREITEGKVLVQTRAKETEVLSHAKQGSVETFYTEELELRKKFGYPPFATFIHLTWQGSKDAVEKLQSEITKLLEPFSPSIYQNPTAPEHKPIMYCLMRLPEGKWPNPKLAEALRALPPSVRIMINPDKII